MSQPTSIKSMPGDIVSIICKHLVDSQNDLHSFMLTHPLFSGLASYYLYQHPAFASPYRFAQFTHTIVRSQEYALLVRVLDLSYFSFLNTDLRTRAPLPLASWREWKYRNYNLPTSENTYSTGYPSLRETPLPLQPHPEAHPHFDKTYLRRDVPLGSLCHVLSNCTNLREINISNLKTNPDFVVNVNSQGCIPTQSRDYKWISDDASIKPFGLPRDAVPMYDSQVAQWIFGLKELRRLVARNTPIVSSVTKRRLITPIRGSKLGFVDCGDCGRQNGMLWSVNPL